MCSSKNIEIRLTRGKLRIGQCMACGLVQVVPMPTAGEIAALYHEDLEHFEPYMEQISVHREYFKNELQSVIRACRGDRSWYSHKTKTDSRLRGNDKKLLDIGCAMGILLEEAKKAGFNVQGIDISRDAVLYCRKKKLDVFTGTLASVGKKLKNNSYDVVTAFEIIEHEQQSLAMMTRVHEILKYGGIAIITTPNYDSFWRKIMGRWWVGYRHPEHVTFWNAASLTSLFKRAGFSHIEIRHDTPRPFPLSFAFTRSADYFPWAGWLLRRAGKLLDRVHIQNPINPWDDLIVVGRK